MDVRLFLRLYSDQCGLSDVISATHRIPFQLGEEARVTIHIYHSGGSLIRTFYLGRLPAGNYLTQDRAAYWEGLNAQGEPVTSGIYFYGLRAGEFTAKRKMLILK